MKDIPLNKRERSIIVYLSGYVVSNLYRKIRNSNLWESDASQEKLALLTAGKASEVSNECYELVNAKNQGGLWYANDNVIGIFMVTENIFKIETTGDRVSSIDSTKIVEKVMSDGRVKSYYSNVQEETGIWLTRKMH